MHPFLTREVRYIAERQAAARRHPVAHICDDAARLIARDDLDAVVIATPLPSHHALAEAGDRVRQAPAGRETAGRIEARSRSAGMADKRGVWLMVDHTFVYTCRSQDPGARRRGPPG